MVWYAREWVFIIVINKELFPGIGSRHPATQPREAIDQMYSQGSLQSYLSTAQSKIHTNSVKDLRPASQKEKHYLGKDLRFFWTKIPWFVSKHIRYVWLCLPTFRVGENLHYIELSPETLYETTCHFQRWVL